MRLWNAWKGAWRRLETAPPVLIAKRRMRQLIGTELRHFVQVRRPLTSHDGWSATTSGFGPATVMYAFGVGDDVAFEFEMIRRFGVQVYAFDPTPTSARWVRAQTFPSAFHFQEIGIANYDGVADFNAPDGEADPCYTMLDRSSSRDSARGEVRRLATLVAQLGHGRLDVLKLDIEGAEYDVLDDVLDSGIEIDQILVEFHHRFPGVGRSRTQRAVERLARASYGISYIAPAGREYAFVKVPEES